jgi:hypothetical protein
MDGGIADFVVQHNLGGAAGAGEFDPALICDLSDANSMLGATFRASNNAAIGAHVDFPKP